MLVMFIDQYLGTRDNLSIDKQNFIFAFSELSLVLHPIINLSVFFGWNTGQCFLVTHCWPLPSVTTWWDVTAVWILRSRSATLPDGGNYGLSINNALVWLPGYRKIWKGYVSRWNLFFCESVKWRVRTARTCGYTIIRSAWSASYSD